MNTAIQFFGSTVNKKTNSFKTVWNTANTNTGSSNANQISLPLQGLGIYNFWVKWGDGTRNKITSWNQPEVTHTYASPGIYTLEIWGICRGWSFAGARDHLKLLSIEHWGDLRFIDINNSQLGAFRGCNNLVINATDMPDFSGTTQQAGFFRDCNGFIGSPNINTWDVSGMTDLSFFFFGTNFNQDISGWDVSFNTNFNGMFTNTPFNQNITGWDVGKGLLFGGANSGMFMGTPFNQDISGWDVTSATSITQMFRNNNAFDQNIGGWNVINVTNFSNFMQGKTSFSPSNLDAIYIGWSSKPVKSNMTINFNTLKYTTSGIIGRDVLTSTYNWTITDGGPV